MPDVGAPLAFSPLIMAIGLGALSLVPFLFVIGTSFAKFSLVLTLLRSALGTQNAPSGMVLNGLAMILSLVVMGPTLTATWERMVSFAENHVPAHVVSSNETSGSEAEDSDVNSPIAAEETTDEVSLLAASLAQWNTEDWILAAEQSIEPWRQFLVLNAGDTELAFFHEIRDRVPPDSITDTSIGEALPAFLLTELAEAFQIGFLLFLPFLLVDLLVGSVLLALGMHMLTPTTVSLPFKLLLFVLVQGWILLSENLVLSYEMAGGL